MIVVTDVGFTARRLVAGASTVSVVAALSRSLYLEIAGELVWLGPPGSTLHPRALVSATLPDAAVVAPSFDLRTAREWRPRAVPWPIPPAMLARESRRLVAAIARVGTPDGFGALLVGRRPGFPLDRAAEPALDFLEACAGDDAHAAVARGAPLLGLGPGLTPAGDDLVGGAFFARRLLASPWQEAAERIRSLAPSRTHRISATLLGDLLDGHGYAPLHDLAHALAGGESDGALDAAARLVRIGHSSGWDMLTGFLGALGSLPRR